MFVPPPCVLTQSVALTQLQSEPVVPRVSSRTRRLLQQLLRLWLPLLLPFKCSRLCVHNTIVCPHTTAEHASSAKGGKQDKKAAAAAAGGATAAVQMFMPMYTTQSFALTHLQSVPAVPRAESRTRRRLQQLLKLQLQLRPLLPLPQQRQSALTRVAPRPC